MSNEIQVSPVNLPENVTPQTVITNTGDNAVQIANSGTVNLFLPGNTGPVYNATTALCKKYYNLFVVGEESLHDPFFLVNPDRALTVSEGVALDISEFFAILSPEAVRKIKTFPSLFASTNHQYGRTDDDHLAYFGVVTDVVVQENGIRVCYQKLRSIPQQRLNEIAHSLEILSAPSSNELDRTHWAIKPIHLIEELKAAGFRLPLPT